MLGQMLDRRSPAPGSPYEAPAARRAVARCGHVVDRHDDFDLERLAGAGIDDADGPRRVADVAAEEPGGLLERALRGRQPDPLRRTVGDLLEPLERERQVRAALRGGHRVDLVDDHRLDALQRVARRRREHQVERLGCGDQQIGWAADQLLPVVRRRVAGAHRHLWRGERHADPLGREPDPDQRRPQVLLDVEREGTQRRQVQHPGAVRSSLGARIGDEPVDRRQERRQRLARAGGCADQRVLAGDDVRPPLDLCRGRRRERGREPLAHCRRERLEHGMVGDAAESTQGV